MPLTRLPALAGLLLAALLAGCGTVSREECRIGDWTAIGLVDGRNGEAETRIADHQKTCARYDLPVDAAAWERGRQEGLKSYCTPISGFAQGVSGRGYRNVCSGRAGSDFLTAYGLGSELERVRRLVREARADARRMSDVEDDLDREIRRLHSRLDDAGLDEREELRERIRDLRSRRLDLIGDRFEVRRDVAEAERQAAFTEARVRDTFAGIFGYPPF